MERFAASFIIVLQGDDAGEAERLASRENLETAHL
jgi:hypothetical protein